MRLLAIILTLLSIATIIPPAALSADNNQIAESVYSEINSPFCKGKLLRDCPSSGASELKQEVVDLAAQGKTKEEIISALYTRYGDEIRAVPSSSFIGKLAWFVPFLFMAIVLIIMGFWVKANISRNREKIG
jgi:cytochrome c-type biogenesis protein CcmH/NrfF